jgi:hypothetical protein
MKDKGRYIQIAAFVAALIAYSLSASSYLSGTFASKYDMEARVGGMQKQLESIDKKLDLLISKHLKQEE